MPAYVTREEFKVLQDEVEGEKLVTRHILEQTRLNGADLAAIKRQLDGVDLKGLVRDVAGLKSDVRDLQSKVGSMDAKLTGLIYNLPAIIAEALRKDRSERRKKL
jgi:seryl-tRNA synthetase